MEKEDFRNSLIFVIVVGPAIISFEILIDQFFPVTPEDMTGAMIRILSIFSDNPQVRIALAVSLAGIFAFCVFRYFWRSGHAKEEKSV